jgi:hypothetical protein
VKRGPASTFDYEVLVAETFRHLLLPRNERAPLDDGDRLASLHKLLGYESARDSGPDDGGLGLDPPAHGTSTPQGS